LLQKKAKRGGGWRCGNGHLILADHQREKRIERPENRTGVEKRAREREGNSYNIKKKKYTSSQKKTAGPINRGEKGIDTAKRLRFRSIARGGEGAALQRRKTLKKKGGLSPTGSSVRVNAIWSMERHQKAYVWHGWEAGVRRNDRRRGDRGKWKKRMTVGSDVNP